VIEAESQMALNTLTEHDFRDAYKEWQKCGNNANARTNLGLMG
jgi:23S rRNA maturation mini-RNase III